MEPLSPVRVVALADLDAAHVEELRAAYEDAFPPDLRVSFEDLAADHVLGFLDGGEALGMAVLRDLPEQPDEGRSVFLRYYLAVRRGGGAGTRMWAALEQWARSRGHRRLLLDVEDPDEDVGDPQESDVRRRRVAFYERNGVQVLPVVGYAPDHGSDLHGHAPAMQLLLAEVDVPPDARQPLPEERLREVLLLVLQGRYGLGPEHRDVRRVLALNGWS